MPLPKPHDLNRHHESGAFFLWRDRGLSRGAWLLAQVADLVLPNLGAPVWVMPLRIRLLALGLPIAFFLAWAYQFDEGFETPEFYDLFFRLAFSPRGKEVVEDPRFLELGIQLGFLPVWQTKGYPMHCTRIQDDIGDHLSCPNWPE